jgi:hypothetical protein
MAQTIKLRRGLAADRTSITPVSGEPIYVTDAKKIYIGDGTTAGGNGVVMDSETTVVSAGAGDAGKIVKLDAAGKVDVSVLPAAVTSGVSYKGEVDASQADPAAAGVSGTPEDGWMYYVATAGSTAFGFQLDVGDWVIYGGLVWSKIEGTDVTIAGTANRISVTGNASTGYTINIDSNYAGQSSISTVGTITSGTWQGTAVADSYIASAATWNAKQDAVTWGAGLSASGATANLDLSDLTDLGAAADASADYVGVYDASATSTKKVTVQNLVANATIDGGSF